MSHNWIECKVKYKTVDQQSGKDKTVNAPFLVDAVSYTEAEVRIYEELEKIVSGSFSIPSMKEANYSDVFFYKDGEIWCKGQVAFESETEKGTKKTVKTNVLVNADGVKDARARIEDKFKDSVVGHKIVSVAETKIEDIFSYFEPKEEDSTETDG